MSWALNDHIQIHFEICHTFRLGTGYCDISTEALNPVQDLSNVLFTFLVIIVQSLSIEFESLRLSCSSLAVLMKRTSWMQQTSFWRMGGNLPPIYKDSVLKAAEHNL